ncbi:hypothetical protein HY333_00540 [Candidatus Collierbacteria bacterium]|nr:hypothetical protein [Candidatus Collierbacteria bacterium]
MPKTKTKTKTDPIRELKIKIQEIKLNIKAGREKNTNAVASLKRELAQLLTKKTNEKTI